jgi:uncharacterized protein (DUF2249 family)
MYGIISFGKLKIKLDSTKILPKNKHINTFKLLASLHIGS